MMPHEFDAAITTYREAQRLCQTLSGDALYTARDEETEALDVLTRTPSESLGDIGEKLKVLQGLMQEGRWFDGSDLQLLDSIRRDVKAMVLKWQG
ncbi:MAG: hypothetical protein WBW37_02830 [Methyloceanibacter sp.]|jgi:hypothetical protein